MTKRILICGLLAICGLWFLSPQIASAGGFSEAAGSEPGHGLDPVVLAGVAAMLIIAKLGGELFERFRLGAAVIDDVLGLLVLAVVAGAIKAELAGVALSSWQIIIVALKAPAFLSCAVLGGRYLVPRLFRHAGALETRGVLLAPAVAFCFLLAWLAALVGLAPIVGAFSAGVVLDEAHFESFRDRGEHRLEELLQPVSTLFTPIFFVLMGMKVDLRQFARWELLGFATALTLVAILGKQVCSLAVLQHQVNRLAVGIGMVPRGDPGEQVAERVILLDDHL